MKDGIRYTMNISCRPPTDLQQMDFLPIEKARIQFSNFFFKIYRLIKENLPIII